MKKVLVANVSSKLIESNSDKHRSVEFELIELNKHLDDGWIIEKYDIVSHSITYNFSIIYQLSK